MPGKAQLPAFLAYQAHLVAIVLHAATASFDVLHLERHAVARQSPQSLCAAVIVPIFISQDHQSMPRCSSRSQDRELRHRTNRHSRPAKASRAPQAAEAACAPCGGRDPRPRRRNRPPQVLMPQEAGQWYLHRKRSANGTNASSSRPGGVLLLRSEQPVTRTYCQRRVASMRRGAWCPQASDNDVLGQNS